MKNRIASVLSLWKKSSADLRMTRRNAFGRGRRRNRLFLEILEQRRVLSTITWNTTTAPTMGDWNVGTNWVGGVVPGTTDTAVIKGLKSPGTVFLNSGGTDSVAGLTTDSSTNLEVISGALNLVVASSSTFGGPVVVSPGASINVGAGSTVFIQPGQNFIDNGTVTLATGDRLTLNGTCCGNSTEQLIVGGTLAATNTVFTTNATGNNFLGVGPGGRLEASGSSFSANNLNFDNSSLLNSGDLTSDSFNLPIYVPYGDIQYLANNTSFQQININAATLASGTLNLNLIGTNTSNLSYSFPGGFTVASAATVAVGPSVPVFIQAGQNFIDNGTVTLATGDRFTLNGTCCGNSTEQLIVGGTLAATNTVFTTNATGNNFLGVGPGGRLEASGSSFSANNLNFDNSSLLNSGDLTSDSFNLPIYVPYGDIQYLANNTSFQQININAATLASGTLNLNLIGTNTSNLSYSFPGGFTVASAATVAVGPSVPIFIQAGQNFIDNGTVTLATGDRLTLNGTCCGNSTEQLIVGGTLAATNTVFTTNATGNNFLGIGPGGRLEASGSSFSANNLNFDNSSLLNSGDLTSDSFNLPIYVPYGDIQYLANNTSFQQININAATLASGTLNLNLIGTNTSNLSYSFPGGFTVASAATVAVGPSVPIFIQPGQNFIDNGTVTLATGDRLTLNGTCCGNSTEQLIVGGTLAASSTVFTTNSTGNNYLSIGPGGRLEASGSSFSANYLAFDNSSFMNSGDLTSDSFNLPIYVPYGDIQYLANNTSFQQININAATLASGTLNLNLIGTNTSNLSYSFPGGFTVASAATVAVGPSVPIFIQPGQNFVDNGTVTLATGDRLTLNGTCCGNSTEQLIVGGTLAASSTVFTTNSTGNNYLTVNSGGNLIGNNSTINVSSLTLSSGASATLSAAVIWNQFAINSHTTLSVSGNDFSHLTTPHGLVATGDPNATIDLESNYWGTTVVTQIEAIILDHSSDATRPTVDFQHYLSSTAATIANPVTVNFSPTARSVTLTANVTDSAGTTINEGAETFTILSGTEVIGQTTAPASVTNGSATAQYVLPGNTPAGQYIIEANYSGSTNYLPAADTAHLLTVSSAGTTTSTVSNSTTFSAVTDQTLSLSAQVGSGAGQVDEGIVTFSILDSGGHLIGSSAVANVSAGAASTDYTFPKSAAGGSYTIQAIYTDPSDFKTSTGTNTLAVSAAPTTVAPSGGSATFNEISGEGVTLAANVNSHAGTINEGSVSFTIVDASSNKIAGPFVYSVASGTANGNASLPADTSVGPYFINAVYNGTPSFATSLPATSNLTVSAAATTTVASPASIGFSNAIQNVPLSAKVMSTAGIVGEGTVKFTILANGSSPIGSPVPASVDSAGGATASYALPANTTIGLYTIQAVYTDSDTDSFSGSSDLTHFLTVTRPPATKLFLATAPSSTATAGTAFATQPVIYEEDQYGNLEAGDNTTVVTVLLASGVGPLQGTLTATVSGGIATFTNLGDNTAETITLLFASGNLTTATSGNIVVSPAAASKLVVTQQPSASATAGISFTTQPVVKEEDRYGNVITNDSAHTVTAARGTIGTDTLMGSPLTLTLAGGVASFGGLTYDRAETMNIGFTTNATGVSSTTSNNIVVNPASASKLVIAQQPSATATAGQSFGVQPVIYEEDQYNNILANDNSTVIAAMLNSGTGPLQGTPSATASGGVARFNSLADNLAETITLIFTNGSLSSTPSSPINVNPGPATKLVIQTQPSTTATAGQSFAVQPVIELEDSNGNLEASDNSSVVTVSLASGNGTLQGTKSVTVINGMATFAGLSDTKAENISLKFFGDGLTAGPSTNIIVSPAETYQLLIHTQPSSAATAGQPFPTQPAIDEVDQYGNLETGDSSTPITASLASGNGPLQGTKTVIASGGVATFLDLADNRAGTAAISLNFSGAGLSAGPSNNIFISPAAAAALVIQTPPYSSVTAGNGLTDPIVINEVDAFGNIETTDNSTVVTISQATGAGTLKGTMTAKVAAGVASFDDVENDTAGVLSLQFAAPSLPTVTSAPSTVMPAPATHLVVTQPPAGVTAGAPFGLTLVAMDNFGNVDTSFGGPVTVALGSGSGGSLTGTTTMTATGGVATFADLVDSASGPISLSATSSTLTGTSTGTVPVSPAPAAKLVVQVQPSQSATAGSPLATQPVIYEEDQFGNLLTGDNTTSVTVYLGSGNGPLQGTLSATVSGGVARFAGLADQAAGTISLLFTGAGLTSIPSVPIVISPTTPNKLVIHTQPSGAATAGQPFATQPVVWEEDQFGNVVTTDSSSIVTASLASGAGPLQGTLTASVSGGIATFTNLSDNTTEPITLKFTTGGLTSPASTSVSITSAPTKLVIHTLPSTTATAGQQFPAQPVIYEEDQFGNVITGDNSTMVTASLASGAGPLEGTTSVTVIGGVATFTNLSDKLAETISLNFKAAGLTSDPTANFVVSPAIANKLVVHTQPSPTATAGQSLATQPVVYEEDQYGNIELGDSSTPVTAVLSSGGPLKGTTTVTLAGGIATFAGLADDTAEITTLKFTAGNLSSSPSVPITVSPATPAKLVIQTQPSATATAGQPFLTQPVIVEEDQFGNVENDNITALAVSLISGTGALQGSTSVTLKNGIATFDDLAYDIAESIALRFTAGSLSENSPAKTVVSPATPTKLVIQTQPSATATAGQPIGTQPVVYEEDAYGNVEVGDNSTVVTASLASGPGPLQGTATATVSGGVARFTNLGNSSAGTIALKFSSGSVSSQATSAIQVAPNATPTVLGETVVMTPKTKKKKAAFSGFKIHYSTAMNISSVTATANYKLVATVKGTKTKPVRLSAMYDASTNSVTLTIKGKNPFAKGGQLTIVTSPPNGVSSQAGVFPTSSSFSFKISANAKTITRS
jgi:hypothetical protein